LINLFSAIIVIGRALKNCWSITVFNILFIHHIIGERLHYLHISYFRFALITYIIKLKFLKILRIWATISFITFTLVFYIINKVVYNWYLTWLFHIWRIDIKLLII
jgi:hypothetical protein